MFFLFKINIKFLWNPDEPASVKNKPRHSYENTICSRLPHLPPLLWFKWLAGLSLISQPKQVSEASRAGLFTHYMGRQYGYGFGARQTAAGKVLGYGGGAFGVNAVAYMLPEKGYVIAVKANYDRVAQLVSDYLLAQVLALLKMAKVIFSWFGVPLPVA